MAAIALLLGASPLLFGVNAAHAQWRRTTPRDTVYVPARQKVPILSNIPGSACTKTEFYLSGTFGIFPGQDSTGFDARYMYSDSNWNAPYPLANPPSWNGTSYQVYLQVSNNYLLSDADSIKVLETQYQPSHEYTAIESGSGPPFEFRIFDRINDDSTGSDYALATGGLHIRMAQYTAGISVQSHTLTFPLTSVGMSSTMTDSIASFGIDPLEVDSAWISGPQQYEFGFSSVPQRVTPFTLPNESANKFTVSFSPSRPNFTSTDTLYLRCPNAECDERLIAIVLIGTGAAPDGSIGPDTLNFGTVRVNYSDTAWAHGFNSGTAAWILDSITLNPAADASIFSWSLTSFPYQVPHDNEVNIKFSFTPPTAQPYEATATIWTQDGKRIPIVLIGNGATPIFTVLHPALNYGSVLTNSTEVKYDTVRNDGQWPAHITHVSIGGSGKQFYSFEDAADVNGFILNPGESRYYTITYHPKFTVDDSEYAYLEFDFDDHSQPKTITLTGFEMKPRITYDTNSINFGNVEVNTSRYKTLGAQNASGAVVPVLQTFDPFTMTFQPSPPKNSFRAGRDSLILAFTPPRHGFWSDWMYLSCNGQYDSIYLYGFGVEAHPLFNPTSLDFGICQDYLKYVKGTTLIDTGDYPLAICDVKITGPDASEFSLLPLNQKPSSGNGFSLPDTLRAGRLDSLYFPVQFLTHALAGRDHYATLEVLYCNGTMDTIPLHAKEEDQYIQFCSYKINFGKVRVGTKSDTTVCFFNGASVALPVDSIWITRNGLPFTLAQDSISVPSTGTSFDTAIFMPLTRGVFTGILHGAGGGMKEDSIVITGIGAQSAPALSTKRIDFGMLPLGTMSPIPQTLSLQDTGDWPLAARIEKINDPNNEFSVVVIRTHDTVNPVVYDSIPIGGTGYYSINFTPKYPELPDHESQLVFKYDDGTVDTVLLTGRDTSNFLAFDRDTLDFGKVRLGTGGIALPLGLVNTSSSDLTAQTLNQPSLPFKVDRGTPILVKSEDTALLHVTFNPLSIGIFTSSMSGQGSPFKASLRDSVFLVGTAAAPMPKLSIDTLDFDTVALGRSVSRSFTLSNLGNWPLIVSRTPVTGPNAGDFMPIAIPTDTTINDSEQTNYSVTFLASTTLQLTPRIGYLTWTMDNGDTFRLVLRANDAPPYQVQIGFPHAYWGRPGDKLSAELDLQSSIPDSLGIQHIRGTVTYDPSVVDGPDNTGGVQPGALLPTPNWTTVIHYVQPNAFSYDISSTTDTLSKPGTLLNFVFKLHLDLTDGASSPLLGMDTLPDTYEAIATEAKSSIFLDSNCGTIHLLAGGLPIASFIRQNTPNPFGAIASTTTLPFDIGEDNTIVTIRLLDPTGREVMRPVDNQSFARGRYEVTIDANTLNPGIYFYEFRAGGAEPQIGKMAVE